VMTSILDDEDALAFSSCETKAKKRSIVLFVFFKEIGCISSLNILSLAV